MAIHRRIRAARRECCGAGRFSFRVEELRCRPQTQIEESRELLQRASRSDDTYARKHAVGLLAASSTVAVRDAASALAGSKGLSAARTGQDPQLYEVIAAAQAANGNFTQAIATQQTAIEKAAALYWNTAWLDERLEAYKKRRSWSGDLFAVPAATRPVPPLKH
jgi:predicted HAD superfamily Cof-like phosphohydrolase